MPVAKPKSLDEALLAVQKEAATLELPKSGYNPHFKNKYTPLDVVLGAVVPLLNKHEIVLLQMPTTVGDANPQSALTTCFLHVPSGLRLQSTALVLPGRADPQGQGGGITFLKRYMVMGMLGLTSDEDDDGNSSQAAKTGPASVVPPAPEESAAGQDEADDPFAANDSPF